MKNIFVKKEGIVLVLLFVLLINVGFVFAETNQSADYYGAKVGDGNRAREFMALEDKQSVWEQTTNPLVKENILENVLKEINLERTVAGSEVKLIQDAKSNFVDKLKKNGASDLLINNLEATAKLAKLAGIDARREKSPLEIKEMKGFDNPNLKWEKGKKNIIGDGKVWLNLETLPFGVDRLEYRTSKGDDGKETGEFVLKMQQGGSLVLKPGSTDENGNLAFISKLSDKGLKQFINVGNTESLSMKDFMFISGKGEIVADKDGFSFGGDKSETTKARLGDFYISRRTDSKVEEGYVHFGEDRLVMKGLDYTRDEFVRTATTSGEFVVLFGNPDQMAKQVSFTDYDNAFNAKGKIYFNFDSTGKIDGIWKSGYNGNEWIDLKSGEVSGELKKIYDASGESVRKMIDDISSGKNINYVGLKERFYGSTLIDGKKVESPLKTYANELKTESSYSNYLAMDGNNFYVNGKGKIELLTNANSLVGIDANDFTVKSGKGVIKFKGDDILYDPTQGPSSYKIDEISMKNNGVNDITKVYRLDANAESFQNRETVNLGRLTKVASINSELLGLKGSGFSVPIAVDVRMEVPREKAAEVQKLVSSYASGEYTTSAVNALMATDSRLFLDLNIPNLDNAGLNGEAVRKLISEELWPMVAKEIPSRMIQLPTGDSAFSKDAQNAITSIQSEIMTGLSDVKQISGNSISFGLKNNPSNLDNPSILIQIPGESKIREIPLSGIGGTFIKDTIEASIRLPDIEKNDIPYAYGTISYIPFSGTPSDNKNGYAFNKWLQRMVFDNIGLNNDKKTYGWFGNQYINRMLSKDDDVFFKDPKTGFLKKYFVNGNEIAK